MPFSLRLGGPRSFDSRVWSSRCRKPITIRKATDASLSALQAMFYSPTGHHGDFEIAWGAREEGHPGRRPSLGMPHRHSGSLVCRFVRLSTCRIRGRHYRKGARRRLWRCCHELNSETRLVGEGCPGEQAVISECSTMLFVCAETRFLVGLRRPFTGERRYSVEIYARCVRYRRRPFVGRAPAMMEWLFRPSGAPRLRVFAAPVFC
jgi:hypothetical protein